MAECWEDEERRTDPADGEAYTKAEFLDEYGTLAEWSTAVPCAPRPRPAPEDPAPEPAAVPQRRAVSDELPPGDEFDRVFAALKAEVEGADSDGKLQLSQYAGPGGVRVVCQEAFHHNFDLTHEHWGEVVPPELDVTAACACCKGSLEGHSHGGIRPSQRIAFVQLLVTGDKAAGKTTWLNGLTTGHLRVLQAMRYDAGVFYNIWYAPQTADLSALLESMRRRRLPFFQTELAHGAMLLQASELRFFLEDEELGDADDGGPSAAVCAALEDSEHAMVRLLELGADGLHQIRNLADEREPAKAALLRQVAQTVRAAVRIAYFVSLSSLLTPAAGDEGGAGEGGPAALMQRLQYLAEAAPRAELVLLCTSPTDGCDAPTEGPIGAAAARLCAEAAGCGDVEELAAMPALGAVRWLAERAGMAECRVYRAEHLGGDGEVDQHACLRTLRRLLRGDTLLTPGGALPIVAEQVANMLLHRGTQLVNADSFAELMEDFEGAIEGADVYRSVVHPMVVLPPSAVLAHFDSAMQLLAKWGIAAPASSCGTIPLLVEWTDGADSGRLSLHPRGEPGCWRLLRLPACVAEAQKGLNLFASDASAHRVSDAARAAILSEAETLCAHCDAESVREVLLDLAMATAFLGRAAASDRLSASLSLPAGCPLRVALREAGGEVSGPHWTLALQLTEP
eukprot:TRINITY_DN26518_c1_g1_i1.p1 TRINITY_DN26518_c1_g1~~TRINITY_DN26518_c1_g1_i1.p1  ORF type:complete len:699 (+),score=221.85 TRINITY_DN26518_c1_g1_i1:56-2098(+)